MGNRVSYTIHTHLFSYVGLNVTHVRLTISVVVEIVLVIELLLGSYLIYLWEQNYCKTLNYITSFQQNG